MRPTWLPRFVGDRLARQAILSGREFVAGTPEGDMLCDETVEEDAIDATLAARVEALTSSGLISATANRRALRISQEPLDVFVGTWRHMRESRRAATSARRS